MDDRLRLIRDGNGAGEHRFVAPGLFLSFHLGHFLTLEQLTTDGLWSGRCLYGDVKVMLLGEDRTFRHGRPCRFAHFSLDNVRLERYGVPAATLRPHTLLRDPPLRHLVEALLAETATGSTCRLFEDSVVLAIVARLSALNGRNMPPVRRGLGTIKLKRALDLIEGRLAGNISIDELAAAVDMSPSHFSALFTASMGEPPHRYQTRRRVESARDLLLAGSTPANAALAVGFYDQSHLSRHLRRVLGISPSAIRKFR
jgi:AraC family transcriptional regulator